jgi:hypothetical protein
MPKELLAINNNSLLFSLYSMMVRQLFFCLHAGVTKDHVSILGLEEGAEQDPLQWVTMQQWPSVLAHSAIYQST